MKIMATAWLQTCWNLNSSSNDLPTVGIRKIFAKKSEVTIIIVSEEIIVLVFHLQGSKYYVDCIAYMILLFITNLGERC